MKRKVLKTGIMAAFVASVLAGCDSNDAQDTYTYNGAGGKLEQSFSVKSVDQCIAEGAGNPKQCQEAWEQTQKAHEQTAPKFNDKSSCESSAGVECQVTRVQHSDGTWTDVFVPALAGMVIGNMLSGPKHYPQPIYIERDRERRFVTGSGVYVPPGQGYLGSNTFNKPAASVAFSRPKSYTAPVRSVVSKSGVVSSKGTVVSRSGGFGSSAKGSAAG